MASVHRCNVTLNLFVSRQDGVLVLRVSNFRDTLIYWLVFVKIDTLRRYPNEIVQRFEFPVVRSVRVSELDLLTKDFRISVDRVQFYRELKRT